MCTLLIFAARILDSLVSPKPLYDSNGSFVTVVVTV